MATFNSYAVVIHEKMRLEIRDCNIRKTLDISKIRFLLQRLELLILDSPKIYKD